MAAEITSEMIKNLRERTGVGMAKCKQALEAAAGDMEKAIDILRKEGAASAVKKSTRETNEGIIGSKDDEKKIVVMEVNAETDFVVKNEKFAHFVDILLTEALKLDPHSLHEFMEKASKGGKTHEELRIELIQAIGENIQVKRMHIMHKRPHCSYAVYRHLGGKIVTVVELEGSEKCEAAARDVAMHVAADSPEYLKADEIPQDVIAREKEIASSQIKNKPADMVEKIIAGKIKAFADSVCLVGQKFIKDNSVTVEQFVAAEGKKVDARVHVSRFLRWEVGGA